MYDHVLIDMKNMLYRAVFAARSDRRFTEQGHHVVNIILHFLKFYLDKFNPKEIHVFWDSPRDATWRREINPEYKNHRSSGDTGGLEEQLANLTEVCTVLLKNMGIRQYYRENMEADDLLYAFCRMNPADKIVVVSSDSDLKQIPFRFKNVDVHSPLAKNKELIEPIAEQDPVTMKALMGDKSDNIEGYYQVGPVKAKLLTESTKARDDFFQSEKSIIKTPDGQLIVGNQRFKDNLRIIDLSLCPYLLDNMMYVSSKQFRPNRFDLNKIREIISKYKLRGVNAEITRYITPFKKLVEDKDGSGDQSSVPETSES